MAENKGETTIDMECTARTADLAASSGAHDNEAFVLSVEKLHLQDSVSNGGAMELQTVAEGMQGSGVRADESSEDVGELTLKRNRPHSASQMSRRTTGSTKSRASLSPSIIITPYSSQNMYSYREGILDQAIAECKKSVVQPEIDGEVKLYWLLTEIDHWDLEKERLILLTEKNLLIIKFDFIRISATDAKRIELKRIEKLTIGDVVYPSSSFMPPREHGGLRIYIGKDEPSIFQRWNPWCQSLPHITLTHHLLIYNKNECDTATYDVEDFAESLVIAVNRDIDESQKQKLTLTEDKITIETYASVSSMIYNQSKIGFNLERGGVSF